MIDTFLFLIESGCDPDDVVGLVESQLSGDRRELYQKWKSLVNMTPVELERFLDSEVGEKAGLSRKEASQHGIGRGRDSARAILRMKKKGVDNWSSDDWKWAARQVSFNSRMRGNDGPLCKDGKKTRKFSSLLVWGHDPRKAGNDASC